MDPSTMDDGPTTGPNCIREYPRMARVPGPNLALQSVEFVTNSPNHSIYASNESITSNSHSSQRTKRPGDQDYPKSSSSFVDSQSEAYFSARIKPKRKAHDCCWLCGNPEVTVDIARVIPKASQELQVYYEKGLLPFSSLDSVENSIDLCKLCHDAFDQNPPLFSIVPSDLQYFIEFEKRDFRRREQILNLSQGATIPPKSQLRRRVPTGEMYKQHMEMSRRGEGGVEGQLTNDVSGLYDVYIRLNFFPFVYIPPGKFSLARSHYWQGSPSAIVLHALRNMSAIGGWVSMDSGVKQQLDELQYLWSMEPKTQTYSSFTLPILSNIGTSSSQGPTNGPPPHRQPDTEAEKNYLGPSDAKKLKPTPFTSAGHTRPVWQWGPLSCSNYAIELVSGIEVKSNPMSTSLEQSKSTRKDHNTTDLV
ncbi:hypothetical protein ABW19_dt0203096 [Dactylella cylindrospora]|nr:hypothetical protein ABW19_dt0203096 [Dactylella cylindrospora]